MFQEYSKPCNTGLKTTKSLRSCISALNDVVYQL